MDRLPWYRNHSNSNSNERPTMTAAYGGHWTPKQGSRSAYDAKNASREDGGDREPKTPTPDYKKHKTYPPTRIPRTKVQKPSHEQPRTRIPRTTVQKSSHEQPRRHHRSHSHSSSSRPSSRGSSRSSSGSSRRSSSHRRSHTSGRSRSRSRRWSCELLTIYECDDEDLLERQEDTFQILSSMLHTRLARIQRMAQQAATLNELLQSVQVREAIVIEIQTPTNHDTDTKQTPTSGSTIRYSNHDERFCFTKDDHVTLHRDELERTHQTAFHTEMLQDLQWSVAIRDVNVKLKSLAKARSRNLAHFNRTANRHLLQRQEARAQALARSTRMEQAREDELAQDYLRAATQLREENLHRQAETVQVTHKKKQWSREEIQKVNQVEAERTRSELQERLTAQLKEQYDGWIRDAQSKANHSMVQKLQDALVNGSWDTQREYLLQKALLALRPQQQNASNTIPSLHDQTEQMFLQCAAAGDNTYDLDNPHQRAHIDKDKEDFIQMKLSQAEQKSRRAPPATHGYPSLVRTGNQQKRAAEQTCLARIRQKTKSHRLAQPSSQFYYDFVLAMSRDKTGHEDCPPTSILRETTYTREQPQTRSPSTTKHVVFSLGDSWRIRGLDKSTMTYPYEARSQKTMLGGHWRQLQQQHHGKHTEEARWGTYTQPAVSFAAQEESKEPHLPGKQWRMQHFRPSPLRRWENDERAAWTRQTTMQHQLEMQFEKKLRQQEDQRVQQELHKGHQQLETQQLLYQEGLRLRVMELHRQLERTRQLREERKRTCKPPKEPTAAKQQLPAQQDGHDMCSPKVQVLRPPPPSSEVYPDSPVLLHLLHLLTSPHSHFTRTPAHRKVPRKKTSRVPHPHHQNPPFYAQGYVASRSIRFSSSSPSALLQHTSWISAAHRKALRQQPI
jgi:hypothetical protein